MSKLILSLDLKELFQFNSTAEFSKDTSFKLGDRNALIPHYLIEVLLPKENALFDQLVYLKEYR